MPSNCPFSISSPGKSISMIRKSAQTSETNRKPLLLMDACFASEGNLQMLKEIGCHYLCVSRKRLKDYQRVDKDGVKTDLSLHPVFHKNDENTETHFFLGLLAYQLVAFSMKTVLLCKFPRHIHIQKCKPKFVLLELIEKRCKICIY